MMISREQLREQVRSKEFAPVYLLFGPEVYLRDMAERTIADRAFADGDLRDFNDTTYTLDTDARLPQPLATAQQLPMMSSRRVVRIRNVRISASGYRDTVTEEDEQFVKAYLDDPSPSTIVIMVADELNGVRKMGKFLRERTTAVDFQRLDERDLPKWVSDEIKKRGIEADQMAVRYLIERTGSDLFRLSNEIGKLAAASMPSGRISIDLIDELVPASRELTNFQLTDHLVGGRPAKAMTVLKRILDDGAEPLALLGLLSYNYRRLLMAKEMMERGAVRNDVAKILKLRYNDQEAFLASARRADMRRLTDAIQRLAKTDLAIKSSAGGSGPAGARLQVEMLVCELALI